MSTALRAPEATRTPRILRAPEALRVPFVETEARVGRNERLPGTNLYWIELSVGSEFPEPVPGQFVMLTPPAAATGGIPLGRPFSIARAIQDGDGWRLGILYAKVGRATGLMTQGCDGAWRVLGPLGRGFPLDHKGPALLVGGGRGTAPLVFLAESLEARGRSVEFLVGARSASDWAGPAEMGAVLSRSRVWAVSEDGSRGTRGRVLDLFEREPAVAEALRAPGAALHACGPHGLLAACERLGAAHRVPAYVSIEAHMACGTGICRSCVVPRPANGPKVPKRGNPDYVIACLEGPVVPAACVDWARDRETTGGRVL
ncbi:MAG: dihydroorotate dehydrogenase electron transfer subunit [Candidatus Eiseniibacteriota bacterium]